MKTSVILSDSEGSWSELSKVVVGNGFDHFAIASVSVNGTVKTVPYEISMLERSFAAAQDDIDR